MAAYDANSPSLLVFAKAGDKKKESPRGMSLFERFKWPRLRCQFVSVVKMPIDLWIGYYYIQYAY